MRTARARFASGVPEPLLRLDLDEGQEVVPSIEGGPPMDRAGQGMRAAAIVWKGTHDPEKVKRDIYEARLTASRASLK